MRIFKSRKFWAAVAGIVAVVAAALSGEITWQEAVQKGVALLMTFIAAIAAVDTAAALKESKQ